jgi:hypothetical protein
MLQVYLVGAEVKIKHVFRLLVQTSSDTLSGQSETYYDQLRQSPRNVSVFLSDMDQN